MYMYVCMYGIRGFLAGVRYECCGNTAGRDGSDNCGIPAGMDFITAGSPHRTIYVI